MSTDELKKKKRANLSDLVVYIGQFKQNWNLNEVENVQNASLRDKEKK